LRAFADFLHAWSGPQGEEIAKRFDFSHFKCVMDVGGGTGALGLALGMKNPGLRGIVMDLPPMCPVGTEYIEKSGLSARFRAVSGDLFTGASYPREADAVLLGSVLHDWSDDKCREILRNCYEALPKDGAIFVCEKVVTVGSDWATFASMMDLWMLVVSAPGAKERTEPEFRALLQGAGFGNIEVVTMNAPRDLILARKA
jgi:3-hydroxy-5-methyl-1-naphthoate 3-O-methyltransferase